MCAIVIILVQSSMAFARTATEEEKQLQKIIDLPGKLEDSLKILEKHSKSGKQLSAYMRALDTFETHGNTVIKRHFPVDVIPNYLALQVYLEMGQDGNLQEKNKTFASLLKAHKQYNLLDETKPLYNLMALAVKAKNNTGPYSLALRLRNMRYLSRYDNKWSEIYFKKLKRVNGWIVNFEVAYWQTQHDFPSCRNVKPINGCILALAKKLPKKSFETSVIEKELCDVKLIAKDKILEVNVCE